MAIPLSVLIVEDYEDDAELMVLQLREAGFDVFHQRIETAAQMREALAARDWDVVLSDFRVPGFGAAPALALLRESGLDIPFITVSGMIGEESAVELMKSGAHDYVMKDHPARLAPAVRREIGEARERRARRSAEEGLRAAEEQFRGLVEQSIAGIYIIQDGLFVYVNRRFAEILGYETANEVIGRDPLSLVVEKDRGTVGEYMRQRLEGELRSVSYSYTAMRKDGSLIDVGVHGSRATHAGRPAVIGLMQDISEKKRAEEEIQRYVAQLEKAFMSTVGVATTLSEMRDPYTAGHERRVAEIAVAIGHEFGLTDRRLEGLRVAGYLHDVGKMTIPSEILSKPGKLSAIEFQLIQGHARASYDVLKDVEFPWPVAQVALQHHERIDGSGYPQGLKGDEIMLEARIMAVADVVEAMSSHRPYRPGLGIEKALAEIERGRGTAYDIQAADACLYLFRDKGYVVPA
ncbi:MAG: PAS domain S-box protein [Proteobacteria bacterium]|nr:PAS domain S-box protein [Pseudomonadota bacterium]